ncbi:leucyl aminopeptidase family protein [Lichenihabitans sp. Uapishka_5]|uniref:leucyl aminopeptidase family protein n=1 Tax=Lichenihabitans sp. Uapishka_5 TaxID=3037302 RepID=UPI0029E7E4DC|nr:leucyl aminopeptidase family protein [Lichenihabitans sp. Uapishka_5]MDX7953090.1 leucyl aminopeptidase family protein [Lichenihabitans sp. Uapishka_5]
MRFSFADETTDATPIRVVSQSGWDSTRSALSPGQQAYAALIGFEPGPGRHCVLPAEGEASALVLFGTAEPSSRGYDPLLPGRLATMLPSGLYRFVPETPDLDLAVLSWALSGYRFSRYKAGPAAEARLCRPEGVDTARLLRIVEAVGFGRDLINTPARDMGPAALAAAAEALALRYGATVRVVAGEALAAGFPLIDAVGAGAREAPRLVDFTWGRVGAPTVTLVGKGVTFDTGGLNIKPDAGMLLMKKDMGGAATALALAQIVMGAGLDLRLRVVLPIVENSISAPSFRPGDVIPSRKGPTVEIGNTDAEGRLILADALALAGEDKPDLLFDFATLTGAARVALGPDLPPFFTDDDGLAESLMRHGRDVRDPVWRLPLWHPYDAMLDGKVGDLNNVGGPFAGAITAALFLRRFVEPQQVWAHFDMFGWVPTAKPGRPEGGEVQVARLLYDFLSQRYPA